MLTYVHACVLTINVLAVLSRSINAAIVAVWVVCERCGGAEIGSILLGGEEARGGTQGLTVAKSNRASTPFT